MHVNELGWEERRASSAVTPWVKADTHVYTHIFLGRIPSFFRFLRGPVIPSPHAKLRTIAVELGKY